MKINVDVTDKFALAGITAARAQHNGVLAPMFRDSKKEGEGPVQVPREEHPNYVATDEAWVMRGLNLLLKSWAMAHGFDEAAVANEEAAVAAKRAKLESLK